MAYRVKEVFPTLQGEGANVGRAAVFCRFTGCNLWTGHEAQRADAVCRFCDTDFVGTDGPGGGVFANAADLAAHVASRWPGGAGAASDPPPGAVPLVVCTGGEPLLQLDADAIDALHGVGFEVAIETNGTKRVPPGVDWVCVSPKAGAPLVVTSGDELKLVVPQAGIDPDDVVDLPFTHHFLQPMDGPERRASTEWAVQRCLDDPRWRLSVQVHKDLGIP